MRLSEFEYQLPVEAIAQEPVEPRDAARLLIDRGPDRAPENSRVDGLAAEVGPGDVVVVNTTRVRPARLAVRRATGGAGEVLLLSPLDGSTIRWEALVRPSAKLKPGDVLRPQVRTDAAGPDTGGPDAAGPDDFHVRLEAYDGEGRWVVELGIDGAADGRTLDGRNLDDAADAALEEYGVMPLPPYLDDRPRDPERYQTVFADRPGSAAAPTAGLHLTREVLDAVVEAGAQVVSVDLEVGLGTFRPMTADRVEDHAMHGERYRIAPDAWAAIRAAHDPATPGSVLAVGTTTLRALESAARSDELAATTNLFLHRGAEFLVVDRLMTNFHLPRSSLLVLIDAFIGPRWRQLYDRALAEGYRFLSFGDATLLDRRSQPLDPLEDPR